jgi:hypothetical protein
MIDPGPCIRRATACARKYAAFTLTPMTAS